MIKLDEFVELQMKYLELHKKHIRLKSFYESLSCLFAEGVEFMTKVEIYDAIKKEWQDIKYDEIK